MSGIGKTHNKFASCKGCPHRSLGCHGKCQGYIYRQRSGEERNERIRDAKNRRDREVYRGKFSDRQGTK